MKVTNWIIGENCAYRVRIGGDPTNVYDRVAFIEKTPRVRVRSNFATDNVFENKAFMYDFLNWAEAPFKGDGPNDPHSRAWCDALLPHLGYEL